MSYSIPIGYFTGIPRQPSCQASAVPLTALVRCCQVAYTCQYGCYIPKAQKGYVFTDVCLFTGGMRILILNTKMPVPEPSLHRTFFVGCRNLSRPFYPFPPSVPSSWSHSPPFIAASCFDAVIKN